jgi:hypothetical protein
LSIALLAVTLLVLSSHAWPAFDSPDLRITAAHVRGAPSVGERLVVDLLLQNLGGRDASKIVLTIQAGGRAGERTPRTKGVWITYEGVAAPSQSLWVMAVTGNEWTAADNAQALSIFGRLTYVDPATGASREHRICLVVPPPLPEKYMDSGPLLVQCAAVPSTPLLPMHAVSRP